MVKAVVLATDGTFKQVNVKSVEDYQKIVDGYIEALPIRKDYVNPTKRKNATQHPLTCYVNEEGLMRQDLATNPYCEFLSVIGVAIGKTTPIMGNILVMATNDENGDDVSVDPYILSLIRDYTASTNRTSFLSVIREINQ